MIDIPPQISFVFLFVWLILFLAGKYQLKKITEFTVKLVESNIESSQQKNQNLSLNEYYQLIYTSWEEEITKYWFVPHKSELFPIRVSPENIVKRINFTPEWVGAYLDIKEIHLKRTKQQQQKIQEIIALRVRK